MSGKSLGVRPGRLRRPVCLRYRSAVLHVENAMLVSDSLCVTVTVTVTVTCVHMCFTCWRHDDDVSDFVVWAAADVYIWMASARNVSCMSNGMCCFKFQMRFGHE